MAEDSCLFCKIAAGKDGKTELVYEDERYAAFRDHRPASDHHYLVVPKRHIVSAKALTAADTAMVQELQRIGEGLVVKAGVPMSEARLGFHWPPLVMVKHLHMHVIAPEGKIGLVGKLLFRRGSPLFLSPDELVHHINGKAR